MRRILALVGSTGLLSMTLVAPANATGAPEVWSSGTFTVQVSVAAADVNGDGYDDLVSTNLFESGNRVLLSTGSAFLPQQNWGNPAWADSGHPRNVHLAGDMDGDGRADAIMVRQHSPRGIFVARSTVNQYGRNVFGPLTQWLDNMIKGDFGNLAADLDADGDTDIIGLFDVATLAARSNGTATLPLVAWAPPILGEKATLAADATGDGSADFILVDTTGTRVVPANPRWHDAPAQWSTTPFFGTRKTLAADIDADGLADLIAVNDTGVDVMRSNGSGYDAPEVWHAEPFYGTTQTLAADVDGDGDADLVAVNSGNVQVLRSQ
jgi:hypothetical protein